MDKITHYRSLVIDFLAEIGLQTTPKPGANGFIDGIELENGILHYDPAMAKPSNLLHEAGHIAVFPSQYRSWIGANLSSAQRRMSEDVVKRYPADHPVMIRCLQAGDPEATAWAWAAGRHLGIPDEIIILDSEYDNTGETVRLGLSLNSYIGINGLRCSGMCSSIKAYPTLTRWLQL